MLQFFRENWRDARSNAGFESTIFIPNNSQRVKTDTLSQSENTFETFRLKIFKQEGTGSFKVETA